MNTSSKVKVLDNNPVPKQIGQVFPKYFFNMK